MIHMKSCLGLYGSWSINTNQQAPFLSLWYRWKGYWFEVLKRSVSRPIFLCKTTIILISHEILTKVKNLWREDWLYISFTHVLLFLPGFYAKFYSLIIFGAKAIHISVIVCWIFPYLCLLLCFNDSIIPKPRPKSCFGLIQ